MSSCLRWCSWGHCQALRKDSAFTGISVWDAILWCRAQQVMSSCHCSWLAFIWFCYQDCQYFGLQFQSSRSKCIFRWSIQRTWWSKLYSFQKVFFLLGSACWLFLWHFQCLLFSKWHLPKEEVWSQTGIFSPYQQGEKSSLAGPQSAPNDSPMTLQWLLKTFTLCEAAIWKFHVCDGTGHV